MTIFRRIDYSPIKNITSSIIDTTNNFLWLAYAQNDSNNCLIKKTSAFSPDQVFFTVSRAIDAIVEGTILSSNIYYAYEDTTLLGEKISLTNPLTSSTTIARPIGLAENPVDIINDGTFIYFLIPGVSPAPNAKILQYTSSGTLNETIELTKSGSIVTNAIGFTAVSGGEIWVTTSNNPTDIVRVFQLSGGVWTFTIN